MLFNYDNAGVTKGGIDFDRKAYNTLTSIITSFHRVLSIWIALWSTETCFQASVRSVLPPASGNGMGPRLIGGRPH